MVLNWVYRVDLKSAPAASGSACPSTAAPSSRAPGGALAGAERLAVLAVAGLLAAAVALAAAVHGEADAHLVVAAKLPPVQAPPPQCDLRLATSGHGASKTPVSVANPPSPLKAGRRSALVVCRQAQDRGPPAARRTIRAGRGAARARAHQLEALPALAGEAAGLVDADLVARRGALRALVHVLAVHAVAAPACRQSAGACCGARRGHAPRDGRMQLGVCEREIMRANAKMSRAAHSRCMERRTRAGMVPSVSWLAWGASQSSA